jgi:hypothetical protein
LHIRHHEPRIDSYIPNFTRNQYVISYTTHQYQNQVQNRPNLLTKCYSYFSFNQIGIFISPSDSQSIPLKLTQLPIFSNYNCQYQVNHDCTLQRTLKPLKTTPEHDPSPNSAFRFHKTVLRFFHIETTNPDPLGIFNFIVDARTHTITNPQKH